MAPESSPRWRLWALLLALGAALLFFGALGSAPLTDRDEGEYAAAVAGMRRSGDYLVPQLNQRLYLEKPILVFWTLAASQRLLGPDEFSARAPFALCAWLLVMGLGLLVKKATGRPSLALAAMAACAFSPLFVLVARMVLTDMLLSLFTTASLLCYFLASEAPPGRERWWYLAAWAGLGLGFLSKGPVALAVVLPTAVIYALWQRRMVDTLRRAQIPWGLVIFLAINLPWYGLAFARLGQDLWQSFFVAQNLTRFSQVQLGHGGGYLYYLPVLLLGAFPFSAAALPALGQGLFQMPEASSQQAASQRLGRFSAVAVLVVLVIFSLAATKQINYILPALPFLAILAAGFLDSLGSSQGRAGPWVFWGLLSLLALLWAALMFLAPWLLGAHWDQLLALVNFDTTEYALPKLPPSLGVWPWALGLCALALAGLAAWWARQGRGRRVLLGLTVGAALLSGLLVMGLLNQVYSTLQGPAVQMTTRIKQRLGPWTPRVGMVTYGLWKPTLLYYLDRDMANLAVAQQRPLQALLQVRQPVYVLSRTRLAGRLQSIAGFQTIAAFGPYLLGGNQPALDWWRSGPPGRSSQAPGPET